ncbi:MAG TPA: hypothetical protein VI643_07690 [Planctomycetota bacterium]|nr:hypothetical protein [Planctomycetota bacterium]
MRSFGPSLERRRVRYLLISGQAGILYGAATFSEDIDIWLDPAPLNVRRFVQALEDLGARVYKLTPSMTTRNLKRGHGFHFVLPPDEVFLDVMGQPPRVVSFLASWRRKRWFDSEWGRVPVICPEDLVELKKTRRSADYDVISNLVAIRASEATGEAKVLQWALNSTFRVEDLWTFYRRLDRPLRVSRPAAKCFAMGWNRGARESCAAALSLEIRQLQELDDQYWSGIIRELRTFRSVEALIPPGSPARAVLA